MKIFPEINPIKKCHRSIVFRFDDISHFRVRAGYEEGNNIIINVLIYRGISFVDRYISLKCLYYIYIPGS